MKNFSEASVNNSTHFSQMDIRPTVTGEPIYSPIVKPPQVETGTFTMTKKFDIAGAQTIAIITIGETPAFDATAKYYYRDGQIGSDATLSVGAGTAGVSVVNEFDIPSPAYSMTVEITCSFDAGDYEVWLGKKGLS